MGLYRVDIGIIGNKNRFIPALSLHGAPHCHTQPELRVGIPELFQSNMSHSLNSLKGGYMGDYTGLYRAIWGYIGFRD